MYDLYYSTLQTLYFSITPVGVYARTTARAAPVCASKGQTSHRDPSHKRYEYGYR